MYAATSRFDRAEDVAVPVGDADLQRLDGAVRVAVADGAVRELYQRSPCRVLFPRVDGRDGAEIVFLNTAGGIAGGDVLSYSLTLSGEARATGTTQAAEKVYRAIDRAAAVRTRIVASRGAAVEWLPQETIVFDGARLHRTTEVSVADGASALALEWLVMGREARGETVRAGEIADSWRVRIGGRLAFADTLRLDGDIAALGACPALLGGCRALATVVYAAPDANRPLDRARMALDALPLRAGATVAGGVLVARLAAESAGTLREGVIRFLMALRGAIGAFPPVPPRVWGC
jgi:urease accessory protein